MSKAREDYFRTKDLTINPENPDKNMDNRCTQVYMGISGFIGLLSIIVLIALNVTNLTTTLTSNKDDHGLKDLVSTNNLIAESIKSNLVGNLNPQVSLINSATSLAIPGMITNNFRILKSELHRVCVPRTDNGNQQCTNPSGLFHDQAFQLYSPGLFINCTQPTRQVGSVGAFNYSTTASITPSPTTPLGCVRIPTFDIGANIYSYSVNLIAEGCKDAAGSGQFWSIGRIIQSYNNTPVFQETHSWYLLDQYNRKSCSTAVSSQGAWLVCTLITENERQDYLSDGFQNIFIGYMDVYGVKKSWYFNQNQITKDHQYAAVYPSVGAGVVVDGKVYILLYGGLQNDINITEKCNLPGCSPATQNTCWRAQHPGLFGGRRVVNMILTFDDDETGIGQVMIKLIPPSEYTIGAEGRLYHYPETNKFYIYLRSSTWYSFLQFGEIDLLGNLGIKWIDFNTFTRPGSTPCNAGNKCPGACLTGVYTDAFLLSIEESMAISVMLTGGILRRGPAVRMADKEYIYYNKLITTSTQQAAYTTTTCFIFTGRPWCASVVEMAPGVIGSMEPVFLLYPIWNVCDAEGRKKYTYDSPEELE